MEKKYTNLKKLESQIITEYYNYLPLDKFKREEQISEDYFCEIKKKTLEESVQKLESLIAKFPDVLDTDKVIEEQKNLESYIEACRYNYSDCYSYIDESIKQHRDEFYDIKTGIRITLHYNEVLEKQTKLVHITSYYLKGNLPIRAYEVNFEVAQDNRVIWKNQNVRTKGIDEKDKEIPGYEYFYDGEVMEYIAPKTYIKR